MPRRDTLMTAQHSTAQHSTAQHSTAQHSTAQANWALSAHPDNFNMIEMYLPAVMGSL